MRHGLVHQRLIAALATAAALAALAFPWADAARADAAQVTVVSPGGATQTLALDALAGSEDASGSYAVRSAAGESSRELGGFSLAAILDAAGADPYGFSYLEVQRPAGGAVVLSRHQALDPGAFAEGPPLVYATTAGTGFLRPSAGPEDLNAGDNFEAPQGLTVVLRKGARLQVRATASPLQTRPGKPVHFSATVTGTGAGEKLTYSWYFDDGDSAADAEATHTFAKRGSYDVVVGVTSAGDDTGASAVVSIQVGPPIAGPDRKGGGSNNAAGAPDHGAADGPSPGDGAAGPLTAGAAQGGAGRAPTDTQRGPRPRVRRGMTGPASTEASREPPPGDRVVGELVSATVDAPPETSAQAAARSGQLQGDGGGVPGAAWGLLATVGLLGAGALAETGGFARLLSRGRPA